MMPKPNWRTTLRPQDPSEIARLLNGTQFFRPDEISVAVELAEERLTRGESSGYSFHIAECDGQIAGYVCYGPTPCTIGTFDLYWIAVAHSFQLQGLGRALETRAAESVRALGGRLLYVETSGKPLYESTRLFYTKVGYVLQAALPDFYEPGDDKLLYCKKL